MIRLQCLYTPLPYPTHFRKSRAQRLLPDPLQAYKEEDGSRDQAGASPPAAAAAASDDPDGKWAAFDDMVESWLPSGGPRAARVEVASYGEQEQADTSPSVLCARCYSLRHYGCVAVAASLETSVVSSLCKLSQTVPLVHPAAGAVL